MIVIVACVLAAIFGGSAASLSKRPEGPDDGRLRLYTFESTIRLDEVAPTTQSLPDELAFRLAGQLALSTLWRDHRHTLLQMRIGSLRLFTKSKPTETQFAKSDTPNLESVKNEAFLVQFDGHRVEKVYLNPDEEVAIRNIKKAIANLFQFKTSHAHEEEMDVCGVCQVTYEIVDQKIILKRKTKCKSPFTVDEQQQAVLGATNRTIEREVLYQMDGEDLERPARVTSHDRVEMRLSAKQEIGVFVVSSLDVIFKESKKSDVPASQPHSLEEAVSQATNGVNLKPDALYVAEEPSKTEQNSLQKVLKEQRPLMGEKQLGTHGSAVAFVEMMKSVLQAPEAEIVKALKNKKNEPVLNQLMDVLGCAQTLAAHNAVLKTFDLNKLTNIDPVERYLWALSVGRAPKIEFVRDFIEIFKKKLASEKLKESLILTISALASKLSQEVIQDVYSLISNNISGCATGSDKCITMYLRALKNLKLVDAKSILLQYAKTGSRVVGGTALKVLYTLPTSAWDEEVLKTAESIYYQKRRVYDSSARTVAADILIDSNPDRATLHHLLQSLRSNTSYEVRKYVLQRLQQTASTNETFDALFRQLVHEQNLFHYDFFAQKGLSNALTKPILTTRDLNASIFTINEVSKSVLKRCHVSVSLDQHNDTMKAISLDMFTSGLSSFLWSDDTSGEEELDEAEDLMAGVELSMYGVHMRPFIFFHGSGELMGHLWSGTATELTPILQAMRLLQDYNDLLPLSNGNIIKTRLIGGLSLELAGQITFSIWNRNAHSFIEARVGVVIDGSIAVDTFYAANDLNLKVFSENEVGITSDLDLYDEILFCLQISQKKTLAKYELEKSQSIPNTNARTRRRKWKEFNLPGRTFQLNNKNNEMCTTILGRS